MNQTEASCHTLSLQEIDALVLDNPFWHFSLSIWKNKALQSSLLSLQDEQSFRINLILFSMWLGLENKLIAAHLESIEKETQSWHEQVVAPLRRIRKTLPKHPLKSDVQQSELHAEQIEQAILFKISARFEKNTANTVIDTLIANLFASRLPETHLLLCIQACLPIYSETDIQSHIRKHSAENVSR